MANNDWDINLIGRLDKDKSRDQINQDINDIQNKLNDVELKAKLGSSVVSDLEKQLNNLQVSLADVTIPQSVLDGLVNQINNALQGIQIGNINVGNINNQAQQAGQQIGQQFHQGFNSAIQKGNLQKDFLFSANDKNNVAKRAQQYFIGISNGIVTVNEQMERLDDKSELRAFTVNIKNAKGEIESLRYSLRNIIDDNGNVTGQKFSYIGGSINDVNVVKEFAKHQKTITDFEIKLNNLQATYTKANVDYSPFTDVFNKFKIGIGNVNDLRKAFNQVESDAKKVAQGLKSQSASLDPIQQALNNMRDMPSMLTTLQSNMDDIKDKTSIASISVKDFTDKYNELQEAMTNKGGKVPLTQDWVDEYQSLMSSVVSATKQVDALKKAEESDNSQTQKQANYYSTILSNYRDIYALKKKLITAGEEESKVIENQIRSLNSSNASIINQLGKQGLEDNDWQSQVDSLKKELDYNLRIAEAHKKDKETQSEINKAQRESIQFIEELEQAYQRIQDIKIKIASLDKDNDSEKISILSQEENDARDEYKQLYNKLRKRKNYDKNSWKETKAAIDSATESQIEYNNAASKDALNKVQKTEIANFRTLKDRWEKQGVLVGEFKAKVDTMETSLASVGSKGELDNLKLDIRDLKIEATQLLEVNREYNKAEKELTATLEKRRATQANSAKEKAKNSAKQELSQQREVDEILSKQESAHKEIWNINKQIATLDPTKNSNQISALNEKKKFYQEIYLSAQKELQAYNNITVSQEHLNSLAEIRKKTEAEISIIQGKQADVDVASKATSKEKAYQDAYTALKKLYDLRIEYAKIDNPSNNATYLYENAIKQQEQAWRKAYANTSESENWDMQKRLELQRQEVAMQEKLEHAYGRVTEAKKQSKKVDEIQHSLDVGDYDAQIETIKKGFVGLSGDAEEAETHVKGLRDALKAMHDATNDNDRLVAEKNYQLELEKTNNKLTIAKAKAKEYVDVLKVQKLKNDIQDWLRKNTAATNEAKTAMTAYLNTLDDVGHVSQSSFNEAKQALDNWDTKMRVAGKLGKSFSETFKEGVKSFTSWAISSGSVMEVWNGLKNGLRTIKDLDTALVDLRKTTDATAQELEDFYYSSNETAKQLGVTTSEVINATSAWSRLGYAIEDATTLAKNSAILASISPEMDIDTATDGLVSTLKAFKIEAEDSLDGVISKINIIGNTQAVDNNDVVDILTRSSSAMAEANNTLEETIALGVAATEITRDADAVGTMLKTVSMRIRGYDEETESYTADLENLSGTIADLTKTASSPGGISLFTDETKTTYKSTYQILKDISEIYDELDDKTQAQLLEALAGKRQGQAVAAIINNFENAEKSMNSMANSAGNAMQEMEVIYDSMDYKLNQTQETATGIAQNLFGREDMKLVIDVFNDFLGLLDKATDKLGLFGTLGLGAGVFAGFKNAGICV